MLRKTFLTLSASVLLGAGIAVPNAALAQFGPPSPPMLAGPPPGLGAGGPPLGGPPAGPAAGFPSRGPAGAPLHDIAGGPPRLEGAGGLRGLDRGAQANFRGVEARAATYSANGYTRNSYDSYGQGYVRGYRYWPYATAAAAYAYGGSDASSDDGCYYVSTYRRYSTKRVLVCHGD